jgi:hypothetical protein
LSFFGYKLYEELTTEKSEFLRKACSIKEKRAKTGWLGIRIMCPSGVTYLSADCCVSELAL